MVRIKRIYAEPAPDDGTRVLVDALWPRGVSRAGSQVDVWAQDLAPSAALRRWFGHDPGRFAEFRRRYLAELAAAPPERLGALRRLAAEGTVTLLFAARDSENNNAVVLAELIRGVSHT